MYRQNFSTGEKVCDYLKRYHRLVSKKKKLNKNEILSVKVCARELNEYEDLYELLYEKNNFIGCDPFNNSYYCFEENPRRIYIKSSETKEYAFIEDVELFKK